MMCPKKEVQGALFYEFSLEDHVPTDHVLRLIDRFVDLGGIRTHLAPFYSSTGHPSIDPDLMIRMLLVGYVMGIRSERRLCEEVHLNLAYRWFCRLDLSDAVPDHSTFSKNRHGRFRDSNLFRHLFETVLARCIAEGLMRYRASKKDCDICALKPRCCPKEPARKILRSIHEGARQMARDITKTDAYVTASYARKEVEMLFAHLNRILGLDRLRLRGPNGAKDEFLMAATAQNLRKLAKLVPIPA